MSDKDDCISRRDAIGEISEHGTIWMSYTDDMSACEIAMEALSNAKDTMIRIIKGLPAVQPDHNADIGKKVEGDCISRQAAIDALAKQMPRSYTPDGSHPADEEIFKAQEIYVDCIESIEILPAAQPEIIRCKDCKFSHMTNDGRYCKYCDQFTDDYGELVEMYFDSNFYCGYAERRTDG